MSQKRKDNKGRVLRNGEVQRPDGKYMFRYTDLDGKRRTIYSWKLVDTDRLPEGKRGTIALRDMEKQIQRDQEDGIGAAGGTTVNDLFKSLMSLRIDLTTTTRCNYLGLYNKHIRPVLGNKKIQNVRFSDIQRLYVEMIERQNLSAATVQAVHAVMYQVFETAVQDHILRVNPAANALKTLKKTHDFEAKKRHALTEDEQEMLISFVYGSREYNRWGHLFTVLLGTGMRIGEALGLRWCDCDFNKELISVNHALLYKTSETGGYEYRISKPKTKAGNRVIPMFADVKEALLKEYGNQRHSLQKLFSVDGYTGFVFLNGHGKVFTPGHVFETMRNITDSYNKIETAKAKKEKREPKLLPKFSAHILRHTFCTRMCENEANIKVIQEVMGHKSSKTTMDVYNEAMEARKVASFQGLEGKIKLA